MDSEACRRISACALQVLSVVAGHIERLAVAGVVNIARRLCGGGWNWNQWEWVMANWRILAHTVEEFLSFCAVERIDTLARLLGQRYWAGADGFGTSAIQRGSFGDKIGLSLALAELVLGGLGWGDQGAGALTKQVAKWISEYAASAALSRIDCYIESCFAVAYLSSSIGDNCSIGGGSVHYIINDSPAGARLTFGRNTAGSIWRGDIRKDTWVRHLERGYEDVRRGVIDLESGNTTKGFDLVQTCISLFDIVANTLSISDFSEWKILRSALSSIVWAYVQFLSKCIVLILAWAYPCPVSGLRARGFILAAGCLDRGRTCILFWSSNAEDESAENAFSALKCAIEICFYWGCN